MYRIPKSVKLAFIQIFCAVSETSYHELLDVKIIQHQPELGEKTKTKFIEIETGIKKSSWESSKSIEIAAGNCNPSNSLGTFLKVDANET